MVGQVVVPTNSIALDYRFYQLKVPCQKLFFCCMAGLSSMIARPHIFEFGHRYYKCLSGAASEKSGMMFLITLRASRFFYKKQETLLAGQFLIQSVAQINFCLFLSCLYFIWQVYSASPIFGVEFEREEKVNTIYV